MTSRVARTCTLSPLRISVAPVQRKAPSPSRSSSSLSVSACVHTVRLARERRRLQERLGRAHAKAAALIHVEVADAGVVAGVEVVDARNAGLGGRLGERIEDVPAQTLFGDAPLAARAVRVAVRPALAAMTALVRAKIRQHVRPAPRVIAGGRRPCVVVARLAAHVDHAVDAGAAAQRSCRADTADRGRCRPASGSVRIAPVGARIADAA